MFHIILISSPICYFILIQWKCLFYYKTKSFTHKLHHFSYFGFILYKKAIRDDGDGFCGENMLFL